MAGMFSSIFSSVGDSLQGMEDRMDGATDTMVAHGESGAQEMDQHAQSMADRGDAAMDRTESHVAHAGNDIGNSLDAGIGVHASFQVSIHGETSGSYTDADGTGHDDTRSFDIDTGTTAVDESLNLGTTADHVFDAMGSTESAFDVAD